MVQITDALDRVDILVFENDCYVRGLRFDDLQEVYAAMKVAGLILAKRVRE